MNVNVKTCPIYLSISLIYICTVFFTFFVIISAQLIIILTINTSSYLLNYNFERKLTISKRFKGGRYALLHHYKRIQRCERNVSQNKKPRGLITETGNIAALKTHPKQSGSY